MSTEDRLSLSVMSHSGRVSVEPCYRREFPQTTELGQAFGLRRDALQRAKRSPLLFGVHVISQLPPILALVEAAQSNRGNLRTTRTTGQRKETLSRLQRSIFANTRGLLGSFLWPRVRSITNEFPVICSKLLTFHARL